MISDVKPQWLFSVIAGLEGGGRGGQPHFGLVSAVGSLSSLGFRIMQL